MSSSPVTVRDLADLRDTLQATSEPLALTGDQRARLAEWVETAIRVRQAQRTRSKTTHHEHLMEAYRAAMDQWRLLCENVASDYAGDIAIFRAENPPPTFKAFLVAYRQAQPDGVCPMCGAPLDRPTEET